MVLLCSTRYAMRVDFPDPGFPQIQKGRCASAESAVHLSQAGNFVCQTQSRLNVPSGVAYSRFLDIFSYLRTCSTSANLVRNVLGARGEKLTLLRSGVLCLICHHVKVDVCRVEHAADILITSCIESATEPRARLAIGFGHLGPCDVNASSQNVPGRGFVVAEIDGHH